MVNLAWIEAKHRMNSTTLDNKKKPTSTIIKLGLPLSLLLLVMIIFTTSGVLYYSYRCTQEPYLLAQKSSYPIFLKPLVCLPLLV
jgi:hypothetical protein